MNRSAKKIQICKKKKEEKIQIWPLLASICHLHPLLASICGCMLRSGLFLLRSWRGEGGRSLKVAVGGCDGGGGGVCKRRRGGGEEEMVAVEMVAVAVKGGEEGERRRWWRSRWWWCW